MNLRQSHPTIEIRDFPGYFIDCFNNVESVRRANYGQEITPGLTFGRGGQRVETLVLFQNGKRFLRSRKRTLIATLGEVEFLLREELRKNKDVLLAKEGIMFEQKKVLGEFY